MKRHPKNEEGTNIYSARQNDCEVVSIKSELIKRQKKQMIIPWVHY